MAGALRHLPMKVFRDASAEPVAVSASPVGWLCPVRARYIVFP